MPVIILALASLAWVFVEIGAFVVETVRRRKRSLPVLVAAADAAAGHLGKGDRKAATADLEAVAWGPAMGEVLTEFANVAGTPGLRAEDRQAARRLRLRPPAPAQPDPAPGAHRSRPWLMGTLIPLSPALEALAVGDVATLSDSLRLAFSITVLGLLVGALAFALSLFRDRIYGQDFSDLEYVAAVLTSDAEPEWRAT